LLLTARQGRGPLVAAIRYTNTLQSRKAAGHLVRRKPAHQATPQGHTVQGADQHVDHHGQPVDKVELLKDETNTCPDPTYVMRYSAIFLHRPAVNAYLTGAGVIRSHQSSQVSQQGGLARPGGANQGHHLARVDVDLDVLKCLTAAGKSLA